MLATVFAGLGPQAWIFMSKRTRRAVRLAAWLLIGVGAVASSTTAQSGSSLSSSFAIGSKVFSRQLPGGAPLTITLADAIQRAKAYNPQFQMAKNDVGLAREDRVQARAAFLPGINGTTQYLYTQGNGTPTGVFIANNAVHEYVAQGNAHEALDLGPGQVAAYRRTSALLAIAKARQEIAARGLVVTVVQDYYGLVVAQRKYAAARMAATEGERFLKITQDLEKGGEVAHSDVIKAQLQVNARDTALQEAYLDSDKARLALAVLLFPDFSQDFDVVDDMSTAPPLPPFTEVEQFAAKSNPDLQQAMAALRAAKDEVTVAWSAHLPTLTLDYWQGIDSDRFSTYEVSPIFRRRIRNLGYSASATLNIPIWDWGAIQSRVRQAKLRREQAAVDLSYAQRQLIANLHAFYAEAKAAQAEVETLRESAALAAESMRLTTLRYQSGEATVLEVVDAQNTLVLARNAFADGQARYESALAALQTLTGNF